jgi:hypothetical protein
MIEFILAPQNLPFAVALGLMSALGLLEIITALMGMGLSDQIDAMLPDMGADLDADLDVGADIGAEANMDANLEVGGEAQTAAGTSGAEAGTHTANAYGTLSGIWLWLNAGQVPVLILVIVFLAAFGLLGLILQTVMLQTVHHMLPAGLAVIPVIFATIIATRFTSMGLARVLPRDFTQAVSETSFIGRIAVITLGTARKGHPAQARLTDRYGQTHYVMVEPENAAAVFETGTSVLLIFGAKARFIAIETPADLRPEEADDA